MTDGNFDIVISSNDVQAGDTIVASMSLRMKDGFYDGTLISSENPRYKNGMRQKFLALCLLPMHFGGGSLMIFSLP